MATVNKDFRIKHGLVVEGTNATVNGYNVLTEASTEFLQDTTAAMLTGGSQSGVSFSYNDTTGLIDTTILTATVFEDKITFEGATPDAFETILQVTEPTQDNILTLPNTTGTIALTSDIVTSTSGISEGTNLYFTDERAQDAIGTILGTGLSYNDAAPGIGIDNAGLTNYLLEGASGTSYGLIGTSTYLDVVNTNGYNKEIELDIVSVEAKLVTDGFTKTSDIAELAQDAIGSAISAGTQTGISVTYTDASNKIDFSVADQFSSHTTTDLSEGTNLYYTDERVDDRVNDLIVDGTGISTTYNDTAGTLTVNNTGVVALSGTASEVEVTNIGTSYTVGLPNDITIAGNITLNGTPTSANHVATVAYVDAATAGLNVHDSVKAATTANINLATDVENGDLLDGVTLATGMRILVKNQTDKTTNGVYTVSLSGAPVRALDYDSTPEVDAGDFIFVEGGSQAKTGWVQTNTITTIGSDNIEFTQFSGAGTYLEGNGIDITGNVISIDTAVTVDKTTAQTLTNKTLTSPTVSGLYLSDNNIVIEGTNDTNETTLIFTDPTQDNTITFKDATGTVAFTSDVPTSTDGLSEGTTNKYFTDERAQDALNSAFAAGTHTNVTITYDDNANSFSFAAQPGYTDEDARDAIGTALVEGSGIDIVVNDLSDTITIANTGVLSITGTTNQVTADVSTGAVTLSLPQNINTTATPTFSGLNVGSVTLTDGLLGSSTASISGTTATVVDSWSASLYSSAKYLVQMKKGNDIEIIEVLVTIDGNNNVYLTEYANVISNVEIGTTDADYLSGNVRLLVTATAGTTVKVQKTLIEA